MIRIYIIFELKIVKSLLLLLLFVETLSSSDSKGASNKSLSAVFKAIQEPSSARAFLRFKRNADLLDQMSPKKNLEAVLQKKKSFLPSNDSYFNMKIEALRDEVKKIDTIQLDETFLVKLFDDELEKIRKCASADKEIEDDIYSFFYFFVKFDIIPLLLPKFTPPKSSDFDSLWQLNRELAAADKIKNRTQTSHGDNIKEITQVPAGDRIEDMIQLYVQTRFHESFKGIHEKHLMSATIHDNFKDIEDLIRSTQAAVTEQFPISIYNIVKQIKTLMNLRLKPATLLVEINDFLQQKKFDGNKIAEFIVDLCTVCYDTHLPADLICEMKDVLDFMPPRSE